MVASTSLCTETHKNIPKTSKIFNDPSIKNVISTGTNTAKYGFPFAKWAVLGLQGIVVKCTAAIFYPTGI